MSFLFGNPHTQYLGLKNRDRSNLTQLTYLVKTAPKSSLSFGTVIPFFVDDTERKIFVRWATHEPDEASVFFPSRRKRFSSLATVFALDSICGRFHFIYQIWIEHIELVALNDFRWGVIMIVVRLIVLIPFITHLYTIKIPWFPGSIFASPLWFRDRGNLFLASKNLLVFLHSSSDFSFIQSGSGC